ncbi:MAG: efflux RND transporter permease subunit [Candidatus Aminicenantales bacterium]
MKIFVERPIATAMFFLALLILGVYSFLNVPIELAPKEEYPQLDIQTAWPGVPPEIIQTQITSPLEEIVSAVKGVKKITSESQIGRSTITLEFDPKTNMEFARLVLREKMAKVRDTLPYGVRPAVRPFVPEDFRVRSFLSYTISGNYSLPKLRELVKEKIEMGLGSVKGVAEVEVSGGADPEIRIVLDKERLKALNIHPYLVSYKLQERIQTYPAGKIKRGSQEFLFKVSEPIKEIKELGDTILTYSGENPIKLRDVARIVPSYGEIYYINRINGQPTVRLTIVKEKGTSTLKVAGRVKKKLEALKKELPQDLVFKVVDDEGEEIQKNLRHLYLLVGIIISVIFFLIFLVLRSFKPSLLVLSSIAFSVLITFNLIYIFKVSINLLTLGGLALGFGLFVDNSIVVFENVLRLREKGMPGIQAAIQGSREVILPVLASTLTTISVFFSFAYFQGRLKIYYLPLAIVISSALAASLLVSFSLIPALSPRMLEKARKKKKEKIRELYERILEVLLRHPVEVLLVILFIFYGTYRWFRSEVTLGEFFRWYSKQNLLVSIGMPPGTDIERTDAVARKFEEKVLEKDYKKEMNTFVSSERAFINITFPPEVENSFWPLLLKEELIQMATNFAGLSIGIYGFDPQGYYSSFGGGTYYDSRIKFFGYNLKKLKEITSNLERTLRRNPRIKEVKIVSSRFGWWRLDSFEYVLRIDKEALRRYDVDPNYLYFAIQSLLQGRVYVPLKARIGGKEMEISIKFPETDRMDLEGLKDALIRTRGKEYLRLGEISHVEERAIAGSIDRENQQFQQTVMWEFRGPPKAAERYKKTVFSKLRLPPGFSATLEEQWRLTEEEKGQIKFAIIFSLVIIFMILASLYESIIQPFFIILAVPLALIGVFVAFVIADFPFDSSAYVGVILLGGIVVNNSILLVDHINLKKKQGMGIREAVLKGARERVRPIFLTTSTTVLGMLPLVLIQLEIGRQQIWSSLALSAVGGLISSTIFILIAIPIFYYYGDSIRLWSSAKIRELRKAWRMFQK